MTNSSTLETNFLRKKETANVPFVCILYTQPTRSKVLAFFIREEMFTVKKFYHDGTFQIIKTRNRKFIPLRASRLDGFY